MRIATWNMQGANGQDVGSKWQTVRNIMKNKNVDAFCLQECGALPYGIQPFDYFIEGQVKFNAYLWETERSAKLLLHYDWDDGSNRCNLAIVAKPPSRIYNSFIVFHPSMPHRPVIGVKIDGFPRVFCIHAMSGHGNDVKGLLEVIGWRFFGKNWIVAGDFNREPRAIRFPEYPASYMTINPPSSATHNSGRKLDFFINNFEAPTHDLYFGEMADVIAPANLPSDHRIVIMDYFL